MTAARPFPMSSFVRCKRTGQVFFAPNFPATVDLVRNGHNPARLRYNEIAAELSKLCQKEK